MELKNTSDKKENNNSYFHGRSKYENLKYDILNNHMQTDVNFKMYTLT